MASDWRFCGSPPAVNASIRSYAGTQLRYHICDGPNAEDIVLGSLCLASTKPGCSLDAKQELIFMQLADMFVTDIISHSTLERRRVQQHMSEVVTTAADLPTNRDLQSHVLAAIRKLYPFASVVDIRHIHDGAFKAHADELPIPLSQVVKGLWEDTEYIDTQIESHNNRKLDATHVVRAIVADIWPRGRSGVLLVGSSVIQHVFDDIDSWFIGQCAHLLSRALQEASLQEAIVVKDDFLRGITHQLRTPIHGVLGSVDLLVEELESQRIELSTPSPSPGRQPLVRNRSTPEILRTIRNSGRELLSTVNSMIKLNRWISIDNAQHSNAIADLDKLEHEMLLDAFQVIPEEDSLRTAVFIHNKLSIDASYVTIDLALLKECLQSLVLNALQATREGEILVVLSAAKDYSTLIFDVIDTGCGIAEENHERIFQAYTKANTHTRGAGLGLTLARRVASAVNGRVSLVSSRLDQGSHFRVEFYDPGFCCVTSPSRPPAAHTNYLPKHFVFVPPEPSPLVMHFIERLQVRGLVSSKDTKGALILVSCFRDGPKQDEQLTSALCSQGTIRICLVSEYDKQRLKPQYPGIHFFSGPFTTPRINNILTQINQICARIHYEEQADKTETAVLPDLARIASDDPNETPRRSASRSLPRALLVDDNLINLRIVRMYCEKRKFPFTAAMDGKQAIDAYKMAAEESNPYALILLDLQMPVCDGIEACTAIRAYEREKQMSPCIVFIITGQDSPNDKMAAYDAGADQYHVKPVSIKTLDRAIAEYFETPSMNT